MPLPAMEVRFKAVQLLMRFGKCASNTRVSFVRGVTDEVLFWFENICSGIIDFDTITFVGFEAFYTEYRKLLVEAVRQNAGYLPYEVEALRELFTGYDDNGDCRLENAEIRRFIASNIPEATRSKSGQQEMLRILQEVAENAQCLDFDRFLWLMRRIQDRRDERDIVRETEMSQMKDFFTPDDVEGFRELFAAQADWFGAITVDAVCDLFRGIPDLNFKPSDEDKLRNTLATTIPYVQETMRFPEFLHLMHALGAENSFGVNEVAERLLKREREKTKRANRPLVEKRQTFTFGREKSKPSVSR